MREKKEQNLTLTLPDRKESGELLEEEESLEDPVIDADSTVELGEVEQEVAELQPQMELAAEDARTSVRVLRKDLCGEQKKVRQQTEKLKHESRVRQERSKKEQEKLKMKLDELRQEFRGHSFDI
jgi:hypothetical protein